MPKTAYTTGKMNKGDAGSVTESVELPPITKTEAASVLEEH